MALDCSPPPAPFAASPIKAPRSPAVGGPGSDAVLHGAVGATIPNPQVNHRCAVVPGGQTGLQPETLPAVLRWVGMAGHSGVDPFVMGGVSEHEQRPLGRSSRPETRRDKMTGGLAATASPRPCEAELVWEGRVHRHGAVTPAPSSSVEGKNTAQGRHKEEEAWAAMAWGQSVSWMPTGKGWLEPHLGTTSGRVNIHKNSCNPGSPRGLGQGPQSSEPLCQMSPVGHHCPLENCQHEEC